MGQINTELGRSSTATISLDTAENGGYATINTCSPSYPASGNPAAMSEWYSYNHLAVCSNSLYAMSDGQTGTYNGLYSNTLSYDTAVSTVKPDPADGVCTWSFWFKPVTTVEVQGVIYVLHVDADNIIVIGWENRESIVSPGSYNNYLYFVYSVFDGVNTSGYINSFANISDANNTIISGVSDGSPWGIGNYGNVDTNDYVLITIVVDAAQVGNSNFVKWYWNDVQLDVPYTSPANGISYTAADNLRSPDWNDAVMYIGGTNAGDIPACWAQLDAFAIYNNTALSSGNITSIYNGGAVNTLGTYQGISTDFLYYNFESDSPNLGVDTAGTYDFFLDEYNSPTRVADPAA